MKRSPIPLIIGLVVLLFVVFGGVLAVAVGLTSSTSGGSSGFGFGDKIGILDVEGVLGAGPQYGADTEKLKEIVLRWAEDDSVRGMVLRINSPGGGVAATQELFDAIDVFRLDYGKPVYASMGDVAASGGFYVAMGADRVYANPGTLTGSIGVIMSFYKYQDLANKVGLEQRVVKSGQFKDMGSGMRDMTDAERDLLNDMIQNVYEQFYGEVFHARSPVVREMLATQRGVKPVEISDDEVDEFLRGKCDGRIFTGDQALEYGMIDATGTLDVVLSDIKSDLSMKDDAREVREPVKPVGLFGTIKSQVHSLEQMAPGTPKLEFRFTM
ncbi:signal peptide peptidase SppA [bacterium]|nr:signal peptide peptidase SppA [bacterium]